AVRAFLDVESVEIRQHRGRLARAAERRISVARAELLAGARQVGLAARRDLASERKRTGETARALGPRALRGIALEAERAQGRERRLSRVDRRRVVERGYATRRRGDGPVVSDAAAAPAGTRLTAELRSGRLALVSEGPEPGPRKGRE